jgi:hypothetical protein
LLILVFLSDNLFTREGETLEIFQKLNLKGQKDILVLQPPESFEPELAALQGIAIKRDAAAMETIGFAWYLLPGRQRWTPLPRQLPPGLAGMLWPGLPTLRAVQRNSNAISTAIAAGMDWAGLALNRCPVRQVSIDEDWSALRFRRVEYIKTMIRHPDGTLTEQGKKRTQKNQD